MKAEKFVVDASLLRELGERLIGRAPIALAELAKNAFDADAATCRIRFSEDEIVVEDDGHGMSSGDFLQHWMRIGTTHKIDERVSPAGRPLTGSKGIGRLSVQFLADWMELESVSAVSPNDSLLVMVDWSQVHRGEDLGTVNVLWDVVKPEARFVDDHHTGTRITLRKLKNIWDADALENLGREVWRLRSPFRRPSGSRVRRADEFEIEVVAPSIVGAEESFDTVRRALFDNWKARIRGRVTSGRRHDSASITVEFKAGYPELGLRAATFVENVQLPIRTDGLPRPLIESADWEILIFKPEGKQPGAVPVTEVREFLAEYGNVSVYDAGFRLPYYGSGRDAAGQDWLNVALDQGRRLNASELLPQHLRTQNKYMQDLPAPGRIFGAVDIDTNRERLAAYQQSEEPSPDEWLQIQPGRDRLHDNYAFRQLRDLVRFSLDFYANRHRLRSVRALERQRDQELPSAKYERIASLIQSAKDELPGALYRDLKRQAAEAFKTSRREERALNERAALLAPLATAGITALALTHELAREVRFLDRVGATLKRIARKQELPELESIATEFDAARKRLKSLQNVFSPLLTGSDSEATQRLRVRPVVQQAVDAMRVLMPGVTFDLRGVRNDLYFPLGSLAEWNAVLQNVLANAWNAMLDSSDPHVSISAGVEGRVRESLRISDTGQGLGVSLEESNKLFEPFERRLAISEDKKSIAIGGHGLGLAIVRMIATQRGANVGFVPPENGFSTTFAITWKGASKR